MVTISLGQNLQAKRIEAVDHINQASGAVRARYITEIAGQQMVYLVKEAEAKAYVADSSPDMANYQHVEAEIGITGKTASDVANAFLSNAALWRSISPKIEAVRLGNLMHVAGSGSIAGILSAREAFDADLKALIGVLP